MVYGMNIQNHAVSVSWASQAMSSCKAGQTHIWSLTPNVSNSFDRKTLGNTELVRLLAELTEHCLQFTIKSPVRARYDGAGVVKGSYHSL